MQTLIETLIKRIQDTLIKGGIKTDDALEIALKIVDILIDELKLWLDRQEENQINCNLQTIEDK